MARASSLDWRGVIGYTVIACGLAWLVASPLWISGQGLAHPLASLILIGVMFTPAIATVLVVMLISRPATNLRADLGLRLGKGQRWGWYWLFAWLVIPLLVLVAPFIGSLFGLYQLDVQHFSGFRSLLEQAGAAAGLEQVPIQVLVLSQILTGVLLAPLINALPVFGEELGWRGYLLPRLLPLGLWPALVLSGVIWGLWHAPIILLGYNYPNQPPWLAVLLMVGFCVIMGVLFGWLRLKTGSVWPAMLAHGSLNGLAGSMNLFFHEGSRIDTGLVGILGITGWIAPLIVIGVLIWLQWLPLALPPDREEPQIIA